MNKIIRILLDIVFVILSLMMGVLVIIGALYDLIRCDKFNEIFARIGFSNGIKPYLIISFMLMALWAVVYVIRSKLQK